MERQCETQQHDFSEAVGDIKNALYQLSDKISCSHDIFVNICFQKNLMVTMMANSERTEEMQENYQRNR